jgi:flagellar biosynthesis anti-sigma factor FlgM
MKIDGNRPNPEAVTTTRVDTPQGERQGRVAQNDTSQGDRVHVSSDGQLATAAAAAAASAPDVRQDKVEQARKALQAGTVGADAVRLADKMIDSMLGK